MANKGLGSSDKFITGDVLNANDVLDSLTGTRWLPITNPVNSESNMQMIGHSVSSFSAISGTNSNIYLSTDKGATWTSKNTDLEGNVFMRKCLGDATHAVAVENGSTACEVAFTDDSGVTWTTKTSANFATVCNDVSFSTAGLIVLGGNDGGGGNHIVYSTDDGGTWTDPTTAPSAEITMVSMFDATTGYAVDSSGNIWKTTDGCDTWVDTTDNISGGSAAAGSEGSILAISADVCLIATIDVNRGRIQSYTNSTNTNAVLYGVTQAIFQRTLGIVKSTNGYYYVGFRNDSSNLEYIFKSTNGGTNWLLKIVRHLSGINDEIAKCWLTEIGDGTDRLLLNLPDVNMIFEEDGDSANY